MRGWELGQIKPRAGRTSLRASNGLGACGSAGNRQTKSPPSCDGGL